MYCENLCIITHCFLTQDMTSNELMQNKTRMLQKVTFNNLNYIHLLTIAKTFGKEVRLQKTKKHKHARLPKTKREPFFLLSGDYFEDSLYYGLSIIYCKCTVSISSLPFYNVLHKSAQSGNYGLVYGRKKMQKGKLLFPGTTNQLLLFSNLCCKPAPGI